MAANTQTLLDARTQAYAKGFTELDAAEVASWHSQSTRFQDIAMQEFNMDQPTIAKFFQKNFGIMKWLRIVEQRTTGSPAHCTWEMLIELEYAEDEPVMGLRKGQKSVVRGASVIEWAWEGEAKEWDGKLEDNGRDNPTGLRGWKIIKEHDYMLPVKQDSEAASMRMLS